MGALSIMKLILILLVTILGVNAKMIINTCFVNKDICKSGEKCMPVVTDPSCLYGWRCPGICLPEDCRAKKDMCKSDEECVLSHTDCFDYWPGQLGQSARHNLCRYVCRAKSFLDGHQCLTSSNCKGKKEVCVNVNGKKSMFDC